MSCLRGGWLPLLLPLPGEGGLANQRRRELCSASSWSLPESACKAVTALYHGEEVLLTRRLPEQSPCWATYPDLLHKEVHQLPCSPAIPWEGVM